MASALSATIAKANPGTDHLAGRNDRSVGRRPFGRIGYVLDAARKAWPQKTAAVLAARTGRTVRAAERWLAGTRDMSAEDFIALLTSDRGADILEALILSLPERDRAFFWARVKRSIRRADLAQRIKADREEYEQLAFPAGPADMRRSVR
jgi:hypothetical protein